MGLCSKSNFGNIPGNIAQVSGREPNSQGEIMSRREEPWDHPPELSPADSEILKTRPPGYSDQVAAVLARFCQLAHLPFDPASATGAGGREIPTDRGRDHLEERLKAGAFRLVTIFSKKTAQGFLTVREDHSAVLAFRGLSDA